jgi:hypothetical protein
MSSVSVLYQWPSCTLYMYAGKGEPGFECEVYSFLGSTQRKKKEKFDLYRRIIRTFDGAQQTLKSDYIKERHKVHLYIDEMCTQIANINASFVWNGQKPTHSRTKSDISTASS